MAAKKNIVVCGYPKSGTTWLSRLVAELVECPLQGNWGFPEQQAQDVEGLQRISEYACYKSHHQLAELTGGIHGAPHKIVYILRDPRDVVISAYHHFRSRTPAANEAHGASLRSRVLHSAIAQSMRGAIPARFRRRRLVNAVINGCPSVNAWFGVSWRQHYQSFMEAGIRLVQYEQLLERPFDTCRGILSDLEIDREDWRIRAAIENQSFARRKRQFEREGDWEQYRFLRKGSYGYWRVELSAKEKKLFAEALGNDLRQLSYPLS